MHYWINQFLATPDSPGGTRHFDFATRLCARGVPVELVGSDFSLSTRRYTRRAHGISPVREEIDGQVVHWLWAAAYQDNDWRRYANMGSFAAAVFAFLMRAPITSDTVFLGSSPSLLAAHASALAAGARGARFVLEVRDLWPESLIAVSGKESVVSRALWRIADDVYRRASRIVVLTERNAEAIAARGVDPAKFVYVPNSINPEPHVAAAGPGFALPADRFCAVYAGAHGPANDLDVVIGAAQLLRDRGDQRVHLVLVGDGTEKARLVRRAGELGLANVTFLDPIPKSAIPALFARCHAGVLVLRDVPLFRHGVSPNKLFDYMGAGLPVVTNVAGDCGDIVAAAGCGEVVTPGDPGALADGLARLARAAEAPQRGAAGRRYVLEHFNRDRLVDRLVEVLRVPDAENGTLS